MLSSSILGRIERALVSSKDGQRGVVVFVESGKKLIENPVKNFLERLCFS